MIQENFTVETQFGCFLFWFIPTIFVSMCWRVEVAPVSFATQGLKSVYRHRKMLPYGPGMELACDGAQ